ncbi:MULTISPECIES: hypothetical protein [Acidianus]|uniref:Uncharacterized protein n=1 Tax=Candidatus Acidianus copahuensis TaxID=1160895 RepID=A0A031LSW9_9CREN|nr:MULTISPECIES: hypothetical protein [Acidianus]EZQ10564.1 hypothetical protein CM19_03795 [Candidatus Acidianus copahuensis]NON61859.1 hypothetical protein [Acidianus sp. RZ1]
MASNKTPKTFLYLGTVLIILGIILLVGGTRTITYHQEIFTVNGMNLASPQTTPNYFINFIGLAIFLFGIGGLVSHFELAKRGGVKG